MSHLILTFGGPSVIVPMIGAGIGAHILMGAPTVRKLVHAMAGTRNVTKALKNSV